MSLLCPGHQLSAPHWITAPCPIPHGLQEALALVGLEGREQGKMLQGLKELWGKNQGQPCGNTALSKPVGLVLGARGLGCH